MDGGAWWAAVHVVPKSRTHLATSLSLFTFMRWRRKWQPTAVFLPGASQGRGSLVGCRLGVAQSRTRLERLSSSSSSGHQPEKGLLVGVLVPGWEKLVLRVPAENKTGSWCRCSCAGAVFKCLKKNNYSSGKERAHSVGLRAEWDRGSELPGSPFWLCIWGPAGPGSCWGHGHSGLSVLEKV